MLTIGEYLNNPERDLRTAVRHRHRHTTPRGKQEHQPAGYRIRAGRFRFSVLRLFCPPLKDEADWLVELAGKQAPVKRVVDIEAGGGGGGGNAPPVTAEEFHSRWRDSAGGKAVQEVSPEVPKGTRKRR